MTPRKKLTMLRSRVLASAAALAAVSLATVLVASPASAATLPEGQRITVADDLFPSVWTADPVTADLTFVGDSVLGDDTEYETGIDVGDDGLGYAVTTMRVQEGHSNSYLYRFDANTGAVSGRDQISIPEHQSLALGCTSLDLAPDGTLYTVCYESNGDDPYTTVFGTLDPTNANLTPLATFIESEVGFTALATNPVTGVLYGFDWDTASEIGDATIWNPVTETFGKAGEIEKPVWAADFDRNGQLFVSTFLNDALDVDYAELDTLDPADGTFTVADYYEFDDSPLEDQRLPLTVWGAAPALAATGATPWDALPLGLGAALLLLAGGAFVATQRLQRRSV